jgi:DNA-binding NtrC family response regulator
MGATTDKERRVYAEDVARNLILTDSVDSINLTAPWWGLHYGPASGGGVIVGRSAAMVRVLDLIFKLAGCRRPTLITGHSGTGKEVVSRALSTTIPGPLVIADCTALPETLIDSELFGHVRGAFTGAMNDRQGRFQAAENGTVLIDEIVDLPLVLQAKLMRVIDTGEYCRLGETAPRRTNAWIIAATNKSVEDAVQEGRFRHDLYARLIVLRVTLPSLCDRQEDCLLLAAYFLRKKNAEGGKKFSVIDQGAAAWIREYSWPYNVRELKNAIDRAFVVGPGGLLRLEYLRDKDETVPVPLDQGQPHVLPPPPRRSAAKGRVKVTGQEILLHLQQVGRPTTSHEIAPRWGVTVRTVERRLRSLVGQGRVLEAVRGTQHFYSPSNHSSMHPRFASDIAPSPCANRRVEAPASTFASPRLTLEPPTIGGA